MLRRSLLTFALIAGLTAAAQAQPAAYEIDASHSAAIFRVKHLGVSYFYGRFNDISGTINFDSANPAASTISIVVKAESVDTANAKRDQHLKGPDFFNARQHPELTFTSKSLVAVEGAEGRYTATGDMTINGVTKEVSFEVEHTGMGADPWGGQRTGAEATLTIKRSDYNINYMPDGLGDDVKLIVSIEAIQKKK
jgi:polyisoprenoid-binding protein YceI